MVFHAIPSLFLSHEDPALWGREMSGLNYGSHQGLTCVVILVLDLSMNQKRPAAHVLLPTFCYPRSAEKQPNFATLPPSIHFQANDLFIHRWRRHGIGRSHSRKNQHVPNVYIHGTFATTLTIPSTDK